MPTEGMNVVISKYLPGVQEQSGMNILFIDMTILIV
jgi:hypothetical protein